jgi:transcription initiation factor TFIIE subunit alpha
MGKDMQVPTIPASERREYVCPRCKADYTQLDVLNSVGKKGFVCERCGSVLNHEVDRTSAGHEKVTRLNNQFKFITDLLLRIDSVVVPDNNFEYAIQSALPVDRDEQHQVAKATVVDPVKPTSVKGLADTGPKKIDIKISTSEGPTEEEVEAERLRKEKIALQNALPAWMANSTVSGESFSATPTGETVVKAEPEKQIDSKKQGLDAKEAQELSSYMEDLKREQEAMAAAAALKKDEESEDEDDEEDEFEDVVATPPVGTPPAGAAAAAAAASTTVVNNQGSTTIKPAPSPLRQSSVPIKKEPLVNGNSGISFTLKRESPGAGGAADDDDRPVKKIKVEETAPAPAAAAAPAAPADDDDDDDEEEGLEFEDV